MKLPSLPLALLGLAALLATLIGGHVVNEPLPIEGSWLAAVLAGDVIPFASHGLIILLVSVAMVVVLATRKVVQVPVARLTMPLLIFVAILTYATGMSAFKMVSLVALTQWLGYIVALFTVVAVVGRTNGPRLLAIAVFVGCSLLAVRGILEYVGMRAEDPTHRIFAGWVNPNATAGMLMMGLMLGLGLAALLPRLGGLLAGVGSVLIGFALVLTQSKGGYIAAAVGVAVYVVWTLLVARERFKTNLLAVGGVGLAVAVMAFGLQARASTAPGASGTGGALARIADAGATQEQSAGFRRNLWAGAVSLIRMNPAGWGLGAYRYESARPGTTTQTRLAHNAYLELAVEASPLAPALLLVFGILWIVELARGAKRQPSELNVLKGSMLAAVIACASHSIVDSNLQYFGIGLVFFMLIGASLQLCADSAAPELLPKEVRFTGAGSVLGLMGLVVYLSLLSITKSQYFTAVLERDLAAAEGLRGQMLSLANFDGEAHYLASQTLTGKARLDALQEAASRSPHPRHYRALAQEQVVQGDARGSIDTLRKALRRDPNNLLVLERLHEALVKSGRQTEAREVAARLVRVEDTPYFRTRAIPEMVPTQTYAARLYLATFETDAKRKIELLTPAVEGYLSYLRTTLPSVVRFAGANPPMDFAGDGLEDARRKLLEGLAGADALAAAAEAADDAAARTLATSAREALDAALSSTS